MHLDNPFLYFNFSNPDDVTNQSNKIYFTHPIKIYSAKTLDEVIPCFKDVLDKVSKGYYAAGYLSYESSPAFNSDFQVNSNNEMPLLWFGIFKSPLQKYPVNHINELYSFTKWESQIPFKKYRDHIHQIKQYIQNQKTDQVNYTIQLQSKFLGNPYTYFKQLERTQSANYQAYLNINHFSILSASPELFFNLKDGIVTTKPMKGTIHRGKTYEQDIENRNWLQRSEKNRYENKLITNLMYEELEKIAQYQSVEVTEKFKIEKYPTVYQMTSTVQAKLASEKNIIDIFKALFPCGSITGSPKKETMEIIKTLETEPREIYCGAIGYITPEFNATFNVPIRTVIVNHKTDIAKFGVGGAITIDSKVDEEFQEILTKAKLLTEHFPPFQLIESFGLNDGKYIVFDYHMNRLVKSARYFNFKMNLDHIKHSLHTVSENYNSGRWKVRLVTYKQGAYSIEVEEIDENPDYILANISEKPIDQSNIFLFHKTTKRDMYNEHRKKHTEFFDTLLWNEHEEVTEFTMGNVVIELDGELVTPPITSGLLPGTYRAMLIQKKIVRERKILIKDLKKTEKLWFINSVREWIPVKLNF